MGKTIDLHDLIIQMEKEAYFINALVDLLASRGYDVKDLQLLESYVAECDKKQNALTTDIVEGDQPEFIS